MTTVLTNGSPDGGNTTLTPGANPPVDADMVMLSEAKLGYCFGFTVGLSFLFTCFLFQWVVRRCSKPQGWARSDHAQIPTQTPTQTPVHSPCMQGSVSHTRPQPMASTCNTRALLGVVQDLQM